MYHERGVKSKSELEMKKLIKVCLPLLDSREQPVIPSDLNRYCIFLNILYSSTEKYTSNDTVSSSLTNWWYGLVVLGPPHNQLVNTLAKYERSTLFLQQYPYAFLSKWMESLGEIIKVFMGKSQTFRQHPNRFCWWFTHTSIWPRKFLIQKEKKCSRICPPSK